MQPVPRAEPWSPAHYKTAGVELTPPSLQY